MSAPVKAKGFRKSALLLLLGAATLLLRAPAPATAQPVEQEMAGARVRRSAQEHGRDKRDQKPRSAPTRIRTAAGAPAPQPPAPSPSALKEERPARQKPEGTPQDVTPGSGGDTGSGTGAGSETDGPTTDTGTDTGEGDTDSSTDAGTDNGSDSGTTPPDDSNPPSDGSTTPPDATESPDTSTAPPNDDTETAEPAEPPAPNADGTYSFSTAAGLSGTVSATGVNSVYLHGNQVASGSWYAFDGQFYMPPLGDDLELGPPTSRKVEADAANRFRVTHTYAAATITFEYVVEGEDIKITARVANQSTHQRFNALAFKGLTVNFGESPTGGRLSTWSQNYTQDNGWRAAHPSAVNRFGAWYLTSSRFGLGMIPLKACLDAKMFLGGGIRASDPPPTRVIHYLLKRHPGPGETETAEILLRFSTNSDWKHLLAPYKQDFQTTFPTILYRPDARPIVYSAGVHSSRITPDNPYGFSGPHLRFDLNIDEQTGYRAYIKRVGEGLLAAGGQTTIIWAPQGWNTRGHMYRPDFDVFPAPIWPHMAPLVKGFHDKGLRIGMLARPGDEAVPISDTADRLRDIDPDNPEDLERLWARFERMIDLGFVDWYLDSFATNHDEFRIMRFLRGRMLQKGNILTYAEHPSDVLLPYSGFYESLKYDSATGKLYLSRITPQLLEMFRWVAPAVPIIAQNRAEGVPVEQVLEWAYAQGVMPLIHDHMVNGKAALLRDLNARYIDPQTNWWKDYPLPPQSERAALAPMYD